MIKAILFDADGVMVNAEQFSSQYEKDFGVSIDETKDFFTGVFQDCLVGKADIKQELPPYLEKWGWKKSVEDFLQYWFRAEHNIDQDLISYVGDLRKNGIICCLGTNQESARTQYMIEKMEFGNAFDKIYSSAAIGAKKPQTEFFQHILNDLKLPPGDLMFWDDTFGHIAVARSMGIHAFQYQSYAQFRERMDGYGLI